MVRLGEIVTLEPVTVIGMQMTHEVVFQADNNCGDGFDENDEEQAEEWFVHGGFLGSEREQAICLSTVLVPKRAWKIEVCVVYKGGPQQRVGWIQIILEGRYVRSEANPGCHSDED